MNLLTFLIMLFFLVALLLLLPVFAGVGSFKVQKTHKQTLHKEDEELEYEGYVPPDELKRRQELQNKKASTMEKLKSNLNVSKEDFPLKFSTKITNENAQLRRRGIKKDNDPSKFDFDLDAFIENEAREDREEQQREFAERAAKSKEDLELLV